MNGEDFSGIRDVGISGSLLLVDRTVARLGPAICWLGGAELGRSTRSSTCSSGGTKGGRGFLVELVGSSVLLFPCLRGVFVLRCCRGSIGRGCWETLGASGSTKASCRPLGTSGSLRSRAGADPGVWSIAPFSMTTMRLFTVFTIASQLPRWTRMSFPSSSRSVAK